MTTIKASDLLGEELLPLNSVVLEWYEIQMGVGVGTSRNIQAQLLKKKATKVGKSLWEAHISGALGELAFAKQQNCFFNGSVNTFKGLEDVNGFEIRTRTRGKYGADLIIRTNDADERIFVLVEDQSPAFHIKGWIKAADAKIEEYWRETRNGPDCWFVPEDRLNPIETLPTGDTDNVQEENTG